MGTKNEGSTLQRVKKAYSSKERVVQMEVAATLRGARTEVPCWAGIIDILTDDSVIEVKHCTAWKHALGQCLAYRRGFPDHHAKIVLFGYVHEVGGAKHESRRRHVRLGGSGCERENDIKRWTRYCVGARAPHLRAWHGSGNVHPMDIERERTGQLELQIKLRKIERGLAPQMIPPMTAEPNKTVDAGPYYGSRLDSLGQINTPRS
jgi:hypothetical protein